jgi:hypothetical protein
MQPLTRQPKEKHELSHAQFVRSFEHGPAFSADDRATVAASKRVGDFNGALWTVKGLWRSGSFCGHQNEI